MVTYDARPSQFTQLSTTADWESFISSAGVQDGIDSASSFVPSLDTGGRNAVISAGQGLIRGQLWRADASVSTPIPAASAQNRIDRLVLQLNRGATSSPLVVQPLVVTGTPSGSPVMPPLTQNIPTGIYQIPVSSWTSASSGSLTGLVDQRQLSGRTVISMTSTFHPSPLNPCLGVETDTGNIFRWNGTTWNQINAVVLNASGLPQTINSTSAQTITGTVYNGLIAGTYEIRAQIIFTANASAGNPSIQVGCNAPNTSWGNSLIWQSTGTGAGANRYNASTSGLSFQGPAMVSGAVYIATVDATIVATGPGAVSLQAFTSIAADTFAINAAKLTVQPAGV